MVTSNDQTDFVKTALRLPPRLHEQIHSAAAGSGRTYNAELISRLDASLNQTRDVLPVRLDPKLRYMAEIAARKQRRSLLSFVEWAVANSLKDVDLYEGTGYNGDDSVSVSAEVEKLWDVDKAERLIRLAINYPSLLTEEEQAIWKMLLDAGLLAPARLRNSAGKVGWDIGELEDEVMPRLRHIWADVEAMANSSEERKLQWIRSTRSSVTEGVFYPGYPPKRPSIDPDDIPF